MTASGLRHFASIGLAFYADKSLKRTHPTMVPSFRKFVGMVLLVTFVIIYAFTAMVIGDLTLQQSSNLVRFVYFAVAGLLWVIPAGAIIWWMERSGKNQT